MHFGSDKDLYRTAIWNCIEEFSTRKKSARKIAILETRHCEELTFLYRRGYYARQIAVVNKSEKEMRKLCEFVRRTGLTPPTKVGVGSFDRIIAGQGFDILHFDSCSPITCVNKIDPLVDCEVLAMNFVASHDCFNGGRAPREEFLRDVFQSLSDRFRIGYYINKRTHTPMIWCCLRWKS